MKSVALHNLGCKVNAYEIDVMQQMLQEKGYNPINQVVGYLISGDPAYISSYQGARNKIQQIERDEIIEVLLEKFVETKK